MFKANDPLTEQIAQYLGHQIVIGQIKPGERIQELRIAGELEVSRGSVREALLIMQRRHLIDILPRRGAVVTTLSESDVRALYEMWFYLLENVVRKTCAKWQGADLEPFLQQLKNMEIHVENNDVEQFYEVASALVTGVHRFAENRFFEQVLEDLLPVARRASFLVLKSGKNELVKAHEFFGRMITNIIKRDAVEAVAALQEFGQHHCELAVEGVKRQEKPSKRSLG